MQKMSLMQRLILGATVLCLTAIPIWIFFIVPDMSKMPGDYHLINLASVGRTRILDIQSNQWKERMEKSDLQIRMMNVEKDVLILEVKNQAYDANTGKIIWEGSGKYGVNRKTRKNVAELGDRQRTDYFMFPQHVHKKDYRLWNYFVTEHAYTLKFEGVEKLYGLETYKFTYSGEPVDKTEYFPWVKGYHIRGDNKGTVWVEPTSGYLVKLQHGGINKLTDPFSHKIIKDFQVWNREFTEETVINQVRYAQNSKITIQVFEIIIPLFFGILSLAFLFSILLTYRIRKR
ncbi:porin PorA family protein [Desulfobacterales bacterium HSG2]|nr:porin PorA family protein [Desulfobacterales bacterium HSG2]